MLTLNNLDEFIKNYLIYLKNTKAIKNMGDVKYNIKHSKKSPSFYVTISIVVTGRCYSKTIRFSNHTYTGKGYYKNDVVINDIKSKQISSHDKDYIRGTIKKCIKRLIHGANMNAIANL